MSSFWIMSYLLSFYVIISGRYHLCYHFVLSFLDVIICVIIFVIISCYHFLLSFPPFFIFVENVTHSRSYKLLASKGDEFWVIRATFQDLLTNLCKSSLPPSASYDLVITAFFIPSLAWASEDYVVHSGCGIWQEMASYCHMCDTHLEWGRTILTLVSRELSIKVKIINLGIWI
jgi:hypothetical protein